MCIAQGKLKSQKSNTKFSLSASGSILRTPFCMCFSVSKWWHGYLLCGT
jgi:hypothetical protein